MFDFESLSLFIQNYGIILFAIVVVILAVKIFRKKHTSYQGTTIFLLGECGSGKTSLLYLLDKQQIQTVSSLKENSSTIELSLNEKICKVPFVDLPGHHHFRDVFFQRIGDCKAIIIMIDSTNDKANANLSELIYNILTNKKYIEREMPILFVLNKQDLINARKQNVIEEEIINEIERIKLSRRGLSEDNEEFDDFLKNEEKRFSFGDFDAKFCQASIKNEDIKEILNFIAEIN